MPTISLLVLSGHRPASISRIALVSKSCLILGIFVAVSGGHPASNLFSREQALFAQQSILSKRSGTDK